MKISPAQIKLLREQAFKVQNHAYAPYSTFHVGAAILTTKGKIYSGCNIENASYGATVCAERVAVWSALASGDSAKIAAVYVTVNAAESWPPCGLCRQVLVEFAAPDAVVFCEGESQKVKKYKLTDLMPEAVVPAALDSASKK